MLLLCCCACAVSFHPHVTQLHADARAFAACRDQLRLRFGSLEVSDADGFRLQTDWVAHQEPGRVTRLRATLFRGGDGLIRIVVEESLLRSTLLGDPEWSPPRAQPELAADLEDAIAAVLGA